MGPVVAKFHCTQLAGDQPQRCEEDTNYCLPIKDQWAKCILAKLSNIDQEEHKRHLKAKTMIQEQKALDKSMASKENSAWTMDLQAALMFSKP
ncbi:hypothetical protein PoB_000062800 [Plakobranchus ocellatus]|uniref:Uncharacterized protein n=1 Tax=Plakobranchus ocellatus TaxID=259542 RepID=A0AAV3XVW5_9GAST|nr:hypothetical protein PoB_000062800 [Plakobranchus ocellatus]